MPTHKISFGGIEFHKYVQGFSEEYGPAFYGHRYLGKRGAHQEMITPGMPRKMRIPVQFTRSQDREDVMNPILQSPKGTLVHPDIGRMPAVLQYPVRGSYAFVETGELYKVELLFEEDREDKDQTIAVRQGPAAHAREVRDRAAEANAAAEVLRQAVYAKYTVGAVAQRYRRLALTAQSLVKSFTADAVSFANDAEAQFTTRIWNPALEVQVKGLPTRCDAVAQALRGAFEGQSYATLQACERTLHAANETYQALREVFPAPTQLTIQTSMSLAVLVARQFPRKSYSERWELIDHIQRINRLARPDCLRPGQEILIPAA